MSDVAAAKRALRGLEIEDAASVVRRKSRDFFWYSPILKAQLDGIVGDFVASPQTTAEIRAVLAACHAHDVPVTVRGAGTGNYGQAMPLRGGCILHTEHMARIAVADDHVVAEPGAVLLDLERAARAQGREIRLFPSTVASATVGGFIAGGASGVGAIRWGGLRNLANIRRVRVMTMEAEPREIDLVGEDIALVAHSYGVTGVITEVELPVDPAEIWVETLLGFPDLAAATRFGMAAGAADDILCRMVSVFEAPIPERYFLRHRRFLAPGEAAVAVLVEAGAVAALQALAARHGGAARFQGGRDGGEDRLPALYELGWNHTTLRALKVDPAMTYLQMMFSADDALAEIAAVKDRFGDELLIHLELTRIMGRVTPVGMPLLRFTDAARLTEVVRLLEDELGLAVFDPHRFTLEEGGMKEPDRDQLAFKRRTDPKGLLNPGKMIAWEDPDWTPVSGRSYLFRSKGDAA